MRLARFHFFPLVLIGLPIWSQIVIREETSVFGFVTRFFFNNGECSSLMGRNGTCYTAEECTQRDGVAEGPCANGLGVCCIFEITTCGGNVVENCTIVSGTRFDGQSCRFRLEECNSDICFFRLDFNSLTLGTTLASSGNCASDTISFSAPGVPVLCGSLSGQHIYLPASTTSDDGFNLNFGISAGVPLTTAYEIHVKQIPCGRSFTPPFGCSQFFFGNPSGQFQSYNYRMGTGYHLNDQNYDICVRPEQGFCTIGYFAFPGIKGFGFGPDFFGPFQTVNGDFFCEDDYVLIPNSANPPPDMCLTPPIPPAIPSMSVPSVTRYCGFYLNCISGEMINSQVATNSFRITVITDGSDIVTNMMVGLQFLYDQMPC